MTNDRQVVLVVDDDRTSRAMLAELLYDDYKVVLAKNGAMAVELVDKHLPDVILLDVMLPDQNGFELLRMLKSRDATRDIPVILITGLDHIDEEERGLALGAADYITKPFHAPIVRLRVRNHMQAVSQRRLLERHAHVDALTEIPNRRRLEQALREGAPPGSSLSIVMIDVDEFKAYNDFYGHAAGDGVLRRVAAALQRQLRRESDLLARYGGEEFTLFLPQTDQAGGRQLAEQMRLAVSTLAIPHARSTAGAFVSVSLGGVTLSAPDSHGPVEEALREADAQLYRAKAQGRNRVMWA